MRDIIARASKVRGSRGLNLPTPCIATVPDVTLIWEPEHLPADARGGAVSVGNFDGVHCGHAALLERLRLMADRVGGPAVVMTFDPHPAAILRPGSEPVRLTEIERRAELLGRLGVDYVVVCKADRELLDLSAREFFDQLLCERIGMRGIVEGPNFFFGKDRQGDTHVLAQLCDERQIHFEVVDATVTAGGMISSTEIRRRIAAGDIETANRLLTAPYALAGTVASGEGRGRELGFPTANLTDIRTLVPGPGVYAGRVTIDGRDYRTATHIGPNLTFEAEGGSKVEAYVLDFDRDLYGRRLQVDLLARVRDIARFASVDQLVAQMVRDVDATRRLVTGGKLGFN